METGKAHPSGAVKRGVISGQRVRVSAQTTELPIPVDGKMPKSANPAPVINTVRKGDVIESIDITCTCGRHMRLLCQQK